MDSIQIFIKLYNNKTKIKNISKNTKIENIIKELNLDNSYLVFNNKILSKNKNLNYYNIQNNDVLFENRRIKGGIFTTIVKALVKIVEFFILILTYLDDFIMIFVKLVEIIPLIFNPKKFIDDIIFGITYAIKTVVGGMISSMDDGTKKNPDEKEPDNVPKVCVPPSLFNLIVLLICPPLALMMHNGGSFEGIFLVVVDAILTVWCYYFPGLIFAALHILC